MVLNDNCFSKIYVSFDFVQFQQIEKWRKEKLILGKNFEFEENVFQLETRKYFTAHK